MKLKKRTVFSCVIIFMFIQCTEKNEDKQIVKQAKSSAEPHELATPDLAASTDDGETEQLQVSTNDSASEQTTGGEELALRLPKMKAPAWIPARAPKWTKRAVHTDKRDGKPYLVASACVRGIPNVALARSSAANRARAIIQKTIDFSVKQAQLQADEKMVAISGSFIETYWNARRRKITCAKVVMPWKIAVQSEQESLPAE